MQFAWCVLRYSKEALGVREKRGCDQRGNGGTQCGGLVDHWRELDFDSERDGKLLEVFKQRKDVILHRTRKDASQISPRVEAGR